MRSELETRFRVLGIGVAVPGLVERSTGTVTLAPHLGWRDEPLADRLAAATGYRCVVSNDARAALVAELWFGAGRDRTDVVYLNGSASGIGGGVVSGGEPLLGRHGYAGELGHSVVNPAGRALPLRPDRVSGDRGDPGRSAGGPRPGRRGGRVVGDRARHGRSRPVRPGWSPRSSASSAGWPRRWANTVNVLDPEVVVLGGFLADLAAATGSALPGPGPADGVRRPQCRSRDRPGRARLRPAGRRVRRARLRRPAGRPAVTPGPRLLSHASSDCAGDISPAHLDPSRSQTTSRVIYPPRSGIGVPGERFRGGEPGRRTA